MCAWSALRLFYLIYRVFIRNLEYGEKDLNATLDDKYMS